MQNSANMSDAPADAAPVKVTSAINLAEETPTVAQPTEVGSTGAKSPSPLSNAFGLMKNRAATARTHLTPQLQTMKEKTSKTLEKYQPSIDKVRSSATAAATMGRERMQPTLSRVKEGSTQGWSMFKTKLAAAAPVAERFQTMGLSVVQDFLGDSSTVKVTFTDDAVRANCQFLNEYKNQAVGSSILPRSLLNRARNLNGSAAPTASTVDTRTIRRAVEESLATPYVLGTILLFAGDLQVLGRMSAVNRACRSFLTTEKRVWRFCVRYGDLPSSLRFAFWEHTTGATKVRAASELDYDTYMHMALSKGEATELILTDVRRTYGRVAPHKRATTTSSTSMDPTASDDQHEDAPAVDADGAVGPSQDPARIQQLSDLLHALAGRFPDVGYCQGMDYIAAHVLDTVKRSARPSVSSQAPLDSPTRRVSVASLDEVERSFWLLVVLFEQYGLREMFGPGLTRLKRHCFQCRQLFMAAFPMLDAHLTSEKILVEMFIVGWFQTLFLYLNALPRETLDCVWDIFLFEKNWKMLLRLALALMEVAEPFVLDTPIEKVMEFFNTFDGRAEELLARQTLVPAALRIKVTSTMLQRLTRQHSRRNSNSSNNSSTTKSAAASSSSSSSSSASTSSSIVSSAGSVVG